MTDKDTFFKRMTFRKGEPVGEEGFRGHRWLRDFQFFDNKGKEIKIPGVEDSDVFDDIAFASGCKPSRLAVMDNGEVSMIFENQCRIGIKGTALVLE